MSINEIKLPFALGEKYWIIRSYDIKETVRCKECNKVETKFGNVKEIVYTELKAVDVSLSLNVKEGYTLFCRFIYRPDYEEQKGASDIIILDYILETGNILENIWIFRTEEEAKAELERRKK